MNNETLVNSIRELCRIHNITVTKLEETLGMSQGLISRWVKSDPSLSKIIDIANYFDVSLDRLIDNTKYKHVDNEFLKLLIEETSNKKLSWKSFEENSNNTILKPTYNKFIEGFEFTYDEEVYDEYSFYTEFDKGYISILCICEYGKALSPEELQLFIQPTSEVDYLKQDYETKDLAELWVSIIKNTISKVPIDVLVENFKQSFVDKVNSNKRVGEIEVSIVRGSIDDYD